MASRRPLNAPIISGFEPLELIGSGGYAEVYLYRQLLPERDVAVKILSGGEAASAAFRAEANLMARVSAHPNIVSIFEASITDDGRPYLVMEYYSGPNYQERARSERFSVPQVLQDGIRLSGAVETAHRAGILHRDLKPANVLTSEYGHPGLTDFGIATGAAADESGGGLSIPWSPPEAFRDVELDARADVYSLAATLYHLLAGRSPFEQPGGTNTALSLMARVERDRLPDLGRSDVPASLDRLLRSATAKTPGDRPETALALARSLQAIENELHLSSTVLEVPDVRRIVMRSEPDDDSTRVRSVTEIDAEGVGVGGSTADYRTADRSDRAEPMPDQLTDGDGRTVAEPPRPTDRRPAAPTFPEPEPGPGFSGIIAGVPAVGLDARNADTRQRRPRETLDVPERPAVQVHGDAAAIQSSTDSKTVVSRWGAVAAFVTTVIGVIVVVAVLAGGEEETATSPTTIFAVNDVPVASFLDSLVEVSGSVDPDGTVAFRWEIAGEDRADNVVYEFTRTDGEGRTEQGRTSAQMVEFDDVPAGTEVCLDVVVTADGFTDSARTTGCVDT